MKKIIFPLSLLTLAVLLTGCGGMKKKAKKATDKAKKVAYSIKNSFPLARYKKNNAKFADERVEEFVLGEEDEIDPLSNQYLAHVQISGQQQEKDFEPIKFNFDEYKIREDQKTVVAYDTEKTRTATQEGKAVLVKGHSDKKCVSEAYNLAVSQKRAQTVANAMIEKGVSHKALKVVGVGDTEPAVNVAGKEERNRRVELSVIA